MTFLSRGFKNLQWYGMTMQDNPNLRPIGQGFGFFVFIKDIIEKEKAITEALRHFGTI